MDYVPSSSKHGPMISHLTLQEEVGRGAHGVVYRATLREQEFAVKLLLNDRDLAESLRLFRREAAIHASLKHPAVPRIFEVGVMDLKPYIISEFVKGQTLASRLAQGPLSLEATLQLGRHLSEALEVVHGHGLIHRDCKPGNILVAASGDIKLIDFGLAGQDAGTPQAGMVGTCRYSAPEQLGMLERPVDGRADLYAVGCVLYECVVGHPPFNTEDLSELLHQHAAVTPVRCDQLRPDCHPVLADILEKLLRKDPDERYQSARALSRDLIRLEALRGTAELGGTFALDHAGLNGQRRDGFVAREAELDTLKAALEALRQGRGQALMIQGAPGSGKTRLAEELVQRYVADNVLVLHGKCDHGDPCPLSPLREALLSHLSSLESLPRDAKALGHQRIRQAAGELGGILQQLCRPLAKVLGVDGPQEEHRDAGGVFFNALSSFLMNLADASSGAILWIDDVQWIDAASREALRALIPHLARRPMMLLMTARNAETQPLTLAQLRQDLEPAGLTTLSMEPLTETEVEALVSQELGGRLDAHFVRRLAVRSQGNPLVICQYLRAMKEAGILVPFWGGWEIDLEALGTLALPTNIYDLLTSRLAFLSQRARSILGLAALAGRQILLGQLAYVCEQYTFREVQGALQEALDAQLIEPSAASDRYTFVHDRILEALQTGFEGDRPQVHRRIADYYEGLRELSVREVFEKAHHLMLGYASIAPTRTFLACLEAASRAVTDHAYARAFDLLSFMQGLGCEEALEPAVRKRFHHAFGRACFETERMEEAIDQFQLALGFTGHRFERAELRAEIARTTIFSFNTSEGARELERAFQELDHRLPSTELRDPQVLQAHLLELLQQSLGYLQSPGSFGQAQGEERVLCEALVDLCETGFLIGYYERAPLLALQYGVLALKPAWGLGETLKSCQGIATFALLMGLVGKRPLVLRFSELALNMARRLGDRQTLAETQSTCAIARHFCGDVNEALELQREVFEQYTPWMGPLSFQNCCIDLAWNYAIRGYAAEELEVSLAAIRRLSTRNSPFMGGYTCRATASAMSASAFLGQMGPASAYYQEVERFRAIVPPNQTIPWVSVAGFQVNYFFQQEDQGAGLETAVQQHQAWGITPARDSLHSKHFYVHHAYARREAVLHAPPSQREAALERFREVLSHLEAAASIPTLVTHLLVLRASLRGLEGDLNEAYNLLDQARRLCYDCPNPWALHEEAMTRARLLKTSDRVLGTSHEAQRARGIAIRLDWRLKRRRIESEFHLESLGVGTARDRSSTPGHLHARSDQAAHLQRQLDALLSLSRASASILDPAEQARIALDESARILGAERAYLFIGDEVTGKLTFQCGRTASKEDLSEPTGYSRTIVEKVFDQRAPLIISTRADAHALESESVMAFDLRSVLAAPLMAGERVLGVIYLDNRLARGVFTQDHVELLLALGNLIATSFQTARSAQLEVQLQSETQRRRLAETLRELNTTLTASLQFGDGLDCLVSTLSRELDFDRAMVVVREDDTLEALVIHGFEGRPVPDFYTRPIFLARYAELRDAHVLSAEDMGRAEATETYLALPLRVQEVLTGFVFLGREKHQTFSQNDQDLGMALVAQASIAIENRRLFRRVTALAERDALTGLYNRGEFFRRAKPLMADIRRERRSLAAIMFDIDHFKRFNDQFGHAIGDEVIRMVASLSGETVRHRDLIGRYGGEEFAVLLPDAGESDALLVAERIRQAIERGRLRSSELAALSVTVSVGAVVWSGEEDLSSLLSRADQALYASKNAGRNQVTLFPASRV